MTSFGVFVKVYTYLCESFFFGKKVLKIIKDKRCLFNICDNRFNNIRVINNKKWINSSGTSEWLSRKGKYLSIKIKTNIRDLCTNHVYANIHNTYLTNIKLSL